MLKAAIKSLIRRTPYRVIRARDANRFQALEECLTSLSRRGFTPLRIVDGGANVGDFARLAAKIFPTAVIDLVEPQPACQPALNRLARDQRYRLHAVALGSYDGDVQLAVDAAGVTTGAHILLPDSRARNKTDSVKVTTMRLDSLLASELEKEERALLKLDLQGWELEALKGTGALLKRFEVVLTEVSFFSQAYEPSIESLVRFLDERDFALHDIAAVAGRHRDNRAQQGDFVFVRRRSALMSDNAWG